VSGPGKSAKAVWCGPVDARETVAMKHDLPDLPYAYDALEPYIDAKTMEIHHTKHHAGYVSKLNAALEGQKDLQSRSVDQLLRDLRSLDDRVATAVRNHGGGHHNHTLFWKVMMPGGGGEPSGDLARAIDKSFGSFAKFKESFTEAALGRSSGWTSGSTRTT
jgi:Fe-Mn family superoxide dismutase